MDENENESRNNNSDGQLGAIASGRPSTTDKERAPGARDARDLGSSICS